MSKLKCIIIEDEPLAVKVLSDYIQQIPFLQLDGTFKDAILATTWLRQAAVDLIFLDINLPRLKGMDFLRTLSQPPAVVITTAYHQYAVEGFDLNVTDYLLKPIEFERFLVAVNKVKTARAMPSEKADTKDYLFITVQKKKVRISFSDINYVESQREYIRIVTVRGEYVTKMGTNEIESLLPSQLFLRVHRSFIVSIAKIESYTADSIEIGGMAVPVGKAYRDSLDRL